MANGISDVFGLSECVAVTSIKLEGSILWKSLGGHILVDVMGRTEGLQFLVFLLTTQAFSTSNSKPAISSLPCPEVWKFVL